MSTQTVVFKAVADFSALHREAAKAKASLAGLTATTTSGAKPAVAQVSQLASAVQQVGNKSKAATPQAGGLMGVLQKLSDATDRAALATNQMTVALAEQIAATSGMSSGWLGIIQRIGYARSAFIATGAAIGAVTAGAAALGVALNAAYEQTEVAFTSILGDGDKARSILSKIVEVARDTPFATQSLTDHVRQMLAAGFTFDELISDGEDGVRGLTITLGDAAAAMGRGEEGVNTMTRAFTRLKATGRVSLEELRILMEQGIPAYEILREQLNLTHEEVRNIGESGVTATEAINALATGLDERFGGAMEAQSKTMIGILNTMRDNLDLTLIYASEGLFNAIKPVLFELGRLWTAFNTDVVDVGFIGAVEKHVPVLIPVIDALGRAWGALNHFIEAAAPLLERFMNVVLVFPPNTVIYIEALAFGFETLARFLEAIPEPLREVLGILIAFGYIGRSTSGMVIDIAKAFRKLDRNSLIAHKSFNAIGGAAKRFATGMKGIVKTGGPSAGAIKTAGSAAGAASVPFLAAASYVMGLGAALYFVWDANKITTEGHVTTADAIEALGDSALRTTDEVNDYGAAIRKIPQLFAVSDFQGVVDVLRAQIDAGMDARDAILMYGQSLKGQGVELENWIGHMETMAEAVTGQEMEFDATDFNNVGIVTAQINTEMLQLRGNALAAANAMNDKGPVDNLRRLKEELNQIEIHEWMRQGFGAETIQGMAAALAGMAEYDPAAFVQGMEAAEQAIRGLGYGTETTNQFLNFFFTEVLKAQGLKNVSRDIDTTTEAMGLLGDTTSPLHGALVNLFDQWHRNRVAAEGLPMTMGRVRDAMLGVGEAAEQTQEQLDREAEAQERYERAQTEAGKRMTDFKKRNEMIAKAFGDFVDPVRLFTDQLKGLSEAEKKAAEDAAEAAGIGRHNWKMFAREAGASLEEWAEDLNQSRTAQELWQANLEALEAMNLGEDIENLFISGGMDLSSLLADFLTADPATQSQIVEDVKTLAGYGEEEYAAEFQLKGEAGVDALIKGIESGDEDAQAATALLVNNIVTEFGTLPSELRPLVQQVREILAGLPGVEISPLLSVPNAGGVIGGASAWAEGGIRDLPHEATIKRGPTLVQWAEPGTGGEAFIPLASSKRKRSMKVWYQTGRILGALNFANGGFTQSAEMARVITNRPGPIVEAIEQAYENILGRGSDPAGLDYWLRAFQRGLLDMEEIRYFMSQSAESIMRHGNLYAMGAGERSVPTVAKPERLEDESDEDYLERYNDLVQEVTDNVWDFNFAQASAGRQVALLNHRMADLQPFSNEWMDLFNRREDVIAAQQDAVESAHSHLLGLLDEERSIRQAMVDLQEDHAERIVDLNEDKADRIADAEKNLTKQLERMAKDRAKREADLAERLADQREDIEERHQERLADLAEQRDERSADAREAQLDREEDLAEQLNDRIADIIEARNDRLEDEDDRFADQIENEIKSLMSVLDPLDEFERTWASSTESIVDNIAKQNAAFSEMQRGLDELRQRGLGEDIIDLLDLEDPENVSQVAALLASSDADLEKLNRLMAARRAIASDQVSQTASDFAETHAENRTRIIEDAQKAMDEAQESFNEALADSRERLAESLADIAESFDEAVADAAEAREESLADAMESYTESLADLAEDFADREADLLERHAETMVDIEEAFQDRLADLNKDFARSMEDLEQDLGRLGTDAGLSYAEAIAEGIRSAIPGVREAALALQEALNTLNLIKTLPTPGLPPLTDPTYQPPITDVNAPVNKPGPGGSGTYTVKKGDTLWKIAEMLYGSGARYPELVRLNNIKNPDLIFPGQVLKYHGGGLAGSFGQSEVLSLLERGEGIISRNAMARLDREFSWGSEYNGGGDMIMVQLNLDGEVVYRQVQKRNRRNSFVGQISAGDL